MNQPDTERAAENAEAVMEQFKVLVETLDEPVLFLNADGIIVYSAGAVTALFGHDDNTLGGATTKDILAPAEHDVYDQILNELVVAPAGARKTLRTIGLKPDGSHFPIELSLATSSIAGALHVTVLVRDMTAVHQAELAQRREHDYRTLIDSLPGGLVLMNTELNVAFGNQRAADMLGIASPAEMLKRPFLDFIDPADRDRVDSATRGLAAGVAGQHKFSVSRSDTAAVPVESSVSRVTDTAGHHRGFLTFLRRVSDGPDDPVIEKYRILKTALLGTASAISEIVKLKDPHVADHQERVTRLACAIAKEMGFPDEEVDSLYVACNLHDVGKLMVPAHILGKQAKLTPQEFEIAKNHVRISNEIAEAIAFPWPVADTVAQHHERLDGSGYPDGLGKDEIVRAARVLGVADVVEAMSSHRPYRAGLGINKALEEVTENNNGRFDEEVAQVCVSLFREKKFHFNKWLFD
jgi:PAS domain S-box-containing protein/putative nucleotidyltransferase with HDIG domain